jgi:hypothetical protein
MSIKNSVSALMAVVPWLSFTECRAPVFMLWHLSPARALERKWLSCSRVLATILWCLAFLLFVSYPGCLFVTCPALTYMPCSLCVGCRDPAILVLNLTSLPWLFYTGCHAQTMCLSCSRYPVLDLARALVLFLSCSECHALEV